MSDVKPDAVVIGAGVCGLTTAVCLVEAGLSVRVWARRPPDRTTSYAAGALWGSFLASHERAAGWSRETLAVFVELVNDKSSGVRMVAGVEAARTTVAPPEWATLVTGFQPCAPAELPAGFSSGWRYTAPVIDMPVYLAYLAERLSASGVRIEPAEVHALSDVGAGGAVVVNCAGLGARQLVPDPQVTPVRGEVLVVDNPGIDRFFAEHTDGIAVEATELTYLLPQGDHVVLGGSAEPGRFDADPDPHVAAAILSRCAEVEPMLRDAHVRERRVGLRPARSQVRLEHVQTDRRHVVHNYGHGGAGVSLSWGCARDVLEILQRL